MQVIFILKSPSPKNRLPLAMGRRKVGRAAEPSWVTNTV